MAGSVNLDGILQIRALHTASDSTLARVVARVEHALSTRSPLERNVDRASRIFVPCVVAAALLTFAVVWISGTANLGTSLMRGITVLVIACPCALGLATPLAITAAIGSASRRGILFRDSLALENLRRVDAIVLDKTGTLTEGSFSVLDFILCEQKCPEPALVNAINSSWPAREDTDQNRRMREETLSLVASLEQYSEHPLGRALVAFARADGTPLIEPSNVEVRKGPGIMGRVRGHSVVIGNRRLMEQNGIVLEHAIEQQAEICESRGETVAFFGWDKELRGLAVFGDRIRSDAAALVTQLKRQKISTYVVSGDSPATARWVASAIGADQFRAAVLPEEKAEFIKSLQNSGALVAMVGDGINDAPALAQADLGIAMGSGADITMETAAVVLMKSSLVAIPQIFSLASKTIGVVRQNLFWAFFYNSLGITLAVAGILNPILAAAAMLLSSVSVVANSLRLMRPVARG